MDRHNLGWPSDHPDYSDYFIDQRALVLNPQAPRLFSGITVTNNGRIAGLSGSIIGLDSRRGPRYSGKARGFIGVLAGNSAYAKIQALLTILTFGNAFAAQGMRAFRRHADPAVTEHWDIRPKVLFSVSSALLAGILLGGGSERVY
jgi:hypothetical protein